MYELLRSALRHRPEYIIVGEVRGKEAMTLLQAMNTGHTTYSTMHADSVRTVINRLENEPIGVPRQMVRSLDVLCVQGFANVEGERVRRNEEVAEIEGIDERTGELDYSTAFEWRAAGDTHADRGSAVTESIREGEGWSRTDLLRELERRRTFLDDLAEHGIEDYRRFTAAVTSYYADPERAVADVDVAARPEGSDTDVDPDPDGGSVADGTARTREESSGGEHGSDETAANGAATDEAATGAATDATSAIEDGPES
jgi:flagellar protein FlaI